MMLFGMEPDANVEGAPVLNGVTVVIKAAEMAVKLKRLGVSVASRIPQSGFALPSAHVYMLKMRLEGAGRTLGQCLEPGERSGIG